MQLPVTGPTYQHESQDVNYQRCVNLFPSLSGPEGKQQFALLPTAGKKTLVDLSGTEVRAIMEFNDTVYVVVNSTVYKLTINDNAETATGASIGTISSQSGLISWAKNPTQIMFTDGTTTGGYIITVSTDTLTQISDADFTGATTVVFMDSYFLYNTPNASTMFATDSNNGLSVDALDVATAEGSPDRLVALAVDKRELWAFGKTSVEIWYDAANATAFPFSRREGAFINQGCAAAFTVLNFDNSLVWLDDRGYIVQANGYSPEVLSNFTVNNAIQSYARIDDAYAFQHIDRGHLFYVISFPTAKKTWAYDATTKQWHERAYMTQNSVLEHDLANCSTRYKRWELAGSRNSGKVFLLKSTAYDDGGDTIHRIRTTGHQAVEYNQIGVDALELHIEAGKALSTGTGSDPQVMMRYSQDGGYTWSNEMYRSMGKIGEYNKRIRWNRLGTGREWLFEFRVSDPIPFSIIDASVDISGGFRA